MLKLLKWPLALMLILSSEVGIAKAMLHLSTSYMTRESEVSGSSSETKTNIYNLSLAGDVDNNAFVGFKYFKYNVDSDVEITASGLCAGYMDKSGFMIIGSWMINPEKTYGEDGNQITMKAKVGSELKGTIIDIGYLLKSGSLLVGPQITYAKFEYDSVEGFDETELEDTSDTYVYPYIAMIFTL
jgi:hypothetical protein